jgi:hypothetical protein
MKRSILSGIAGTAITALGLALASAPAEAQATRTWVARDGDDANPCSFTAPCHSFASAITRTAAFGEINVINAGAYGSVTITKSITIRSTVEAGVLASGNDGITVNVGPNDRVVLDGLDIEGSGQGRNGITITNSGTVDIIRCAIRGFAQNGVNVAGNAGARAYVYNSVILNNGGGLNIQGAGGAANTAIVDKTLLDNNKSFATQVDRAGTLTLIGSTLTGSPAGIIAANGAAVVSYGNNVLQGNGAPTQTLQPK